MSVYDSFLYVTLHVFRMSYDVCIMQDACAAYDTCVTTGWKLGLSQGSTVHQCPLHDTYHTHVDSLDTQNESGYADAH